MKIAVYMLKNINFKQFKKSFSYAFFTPFFSAVSFYRIGIFISFTAMLIQTKDIEGNQPFYESLLSLGFNLPIFLLTPFTGVLADRLHRIKVVRSLQLYYMIISLILTLGIITNTTSIGFLIICTFLYGFGMSLDNPSRYSLVKDIIYDSKDLSSGMGIFSIIDRASQFIGSGLTGFLVYIFNIISCYVFDFFSHLFAFCLLFSVKPKKQIIKKEKFHFVSDLKEGSFYTFTHFPIAISIIFIALNGLFAWPYLFQLPIINSFYLKGSALTLGIIMGFGGFGGTLAGIYMGTRKSFFGLTKHILISIALIGVSFIIFSFSRTIWLTAIVVFVLDFFITLFLITSTTFVQLITEDSKRGRVMGFFTMANFGLIPIGSVLIYGLLGTYLGLMKILFASGIIFIIAGVIYFTLLKKIRKITHLILKEKKVIHEEENLFI